MGNANGTGRRPDFYEEVYNTMTELDDTVINQGTSDNRLPQLQFHQVHGQNVVLQRGSRVARRRESFCKGLAFSNRPITIDENVCIRLTEVASNWSGVLRFGVTNVDPDSYRNVAVPKFACPDLTSKEGYWAKALPERYSQEGAIVHFYVNSDGELYYGVNGVQKGVFLVGINVRLPVWVIVDIYGNSVAVEFIDPSDYRPRSRNRHERATSASTTPPVRLVTTNPSRVALPQTQRSSRRPPYIGDRCRDDSYNVWSFHETTGKNVRLDVTKRTAERVSTEYANGYVFVNTPMPTDGDKLAIWVMETNTMFSGGLAFGLTSCPPTRVRKTELPDDSDNLLDLPDYWVCIKDVAAQPAADSALFFSLNDRGVVYFSMNDSAPVTLMHVDVSLPLYPFFDLYGTTQKIRICGVMPKETRITSAREAPTHVSLPARPNPPSSSRLSPRVALPSPTTTSSSSAANLIDLNDSPPAIPSREVSHSTPTIPTNHDYISAIRETQAASALTRNFNEFRLHDNSEANRPARPPIPPRRDQMSPRPPAIPRTSIPPPPPREPKPALTTPTLPIPSFATSPTSSSSALSSMSYSGDGENGSVYRECSICMSNPADAVVIKCGHACMCYDCGKQVLEQRGVCPICRESMVDVIRFYIN